jgi:hypothetical protein
MPTSATIHIQKIAPGPPSASAVATPGDVADADGGRHRRGNRLERGDDAGLSGARAGEQRPNELRHAKPRWVNWKKRSLTVR